VQRTLERLAQANNMSLEMYRARIEAQGVPWTTFTSDARTELTLSRLREKEVDSKITVTDAEVANYIASQRGPGAGQTNDLHMQHIFVKAPLNASETDIEAAQKKAEALLAEAKGGADFEKLAKANSQAPDASKNGGDLGFLAPSKLPPEFVKAASALRPGEINPDLVRTSDGFEIVRLVERRAGQGTSADAPKLVQTHVRHILYASATVCPNRRHATSCSTSATRSPRAVTSRSSRAPIRRTARRRKAATSAGSARARRCPSSSAR
jgi:peptidyl-prolyl cis-trans isomerase SurA